MSILCKPFKLRVFLIKTEQAASPTLVEVPPQQTPNSPAELARLNAASPTLVEVPPQQTPNSPAELARLNTEAINRIEANANLNKFVSKTPNVSQALKAIEQLPPKTAMSLWGRIKDFGNSPEIRYCFGIRQDPKQTRHEGLAKSFRDRYIAIAARKYQEALSREDEGAASYHKQRLKDLITGELQPTALLDNLLKLSLNRDYSNELTQEEINSIYGPTSQAKGLKKAQKAQKSESSTPTGGGGYSLPSAPAQVETKPREAKAEQTITFKQQAKNLLNAANIKFENKTLEEKTKIQIGLEELFKQTESNFPESLIAIYKRPDHYSQFFGNKNATKKLLEQMIKQIQNLNVHNVNHSLLKGTEARLIVYKGINLKEICLSGLTNKGGYTDLQAYLGILWSKYKQIIL